jgi:L,D-transpeptidase YcbB
MPRFFCRWWLARLSEYRRNKDCVSREKEIAMLPAVKKPVDPGGEYVAVPQLTVLLRRLGDLPADRFVAGDSNLYVGPVVAAGRHFQARHGLEPDGRWGKATLAQLNTPLSQHVRQLQLTLEGWRWMPHSFARPPIVVNIAEFRLRALNREYETELDMKVAVGKAHGHQTPIFGAEIEYPRR